MNRPSNPPSINGSKHVLYPDPITFSRKRHKCWSQTALKCLVCLLFLSTAVLCGLFLMYRFKYHQKVTLEPEVCETTGCVLAAAQLAGKMDADVNPCEDFAQFACGTFYRTATYSEGKTSVRTDTALEEANNRMIKSFLAEEDSDNEWSYVKNMKRFYKACLDEVTIERIGLKPYLESSYAKEWPTLTGRNWTGELSFDLSDVVSRYIVARIQPIFSFYVYADSMDSSKHVIYLDDPRIIPSRAILRRPRHSPAVMAFEAFLTKLAIELGADPTVAAEDAASVVDLDHEIAKILVDEEEMRNMTKVYNPTTLMALGERYTYLDFPKAIRAGFATANISLEDTQRVIVSFPEVFDRLGKVLNSTDKRTLQNTFGFKFAYSRTRKLTKRLRKLSLRLEMMLYGRTEEEPRTDLCADMTTAVFHYGTGKEFIHRYFPEESKTYINYMIDKLQAEFEYQLQMVSWLGEKTKAEAFKKLARMSRKVGYPDKDYSDEDIDKKYENYTMASDNFYNNLETWKSQKNIEYLRKLREDTDKDAWVLGPYIVNAFYDPSKNSIFFPAGFLQPPFFSVQFPDSVNYGGIGTVIGHEITHGFDDKGRQYDERGNLRDWWQSRDLYNFKQASQCFVLQYGNFTDESVGMRVNGITTQGENVADNGGLKQSYRAYKRLVAEKGEPKRLPGLGLTNDQTFFLAYAQSWCSKMTDATKRIAMDKPSHPPGRFRILGPLQNSPEFSQSYNCPVGSPMNPVNKCSIW